MKFMIYVTFYGRNNDFSKIIKVPEKGWLILEVTEDKYIVKHIRGTVLYAFDKEDIKSITIERLR